MKIESNLSILHNFVAPDTILAASVCTESTKFISSWLRLSHIESLYSNNGRIKDV